MAKYANVQKMRCFLETAKRERTSSIFGIHALCSSGSIYVSRIEAGGLLRVSSTAAVHRGTPIERHLRGKAIEQGTS